MKLRKYQQEAKTAILEQWHQGNKRTLLTLPTGCGKTIVFAAVIDELVKAGRHPLVLAHRDELLKQAADKIYKAYGLECAFEKAEQTCIGTWAPVAVGSVQSVSRRLERFGFVRVGEWSFEDASYMIGQLAADAWSIPKWVGNAWEYRPKKEGEILDWNEMI